MTFEFSRSFELGIHFGKRGTLAGFKVRWYGIATPNHFFGILRLKGKI
jgi:hypothetical protein